MNLGLASDGGPGKASPIRDIGATPGGSPAASPTEARSGAEVEVEAAAMSAAQLKKLYEQALEREKAVDVKKSRKEAPARKKK